MAWTRYICIRSRMGSEEATKAGRGKRMTSNAQDEAGAPMPKYTNRLIFETSPYLLQHAHNPVDWYPWGEAAFAKSREEDKPILFSVGYSACHWCHRLLEDTFEAETTPPLMNDSFLSWKGS